MLCEPTACLGLLLWLPLACLFSPTLSLARPFACRAHALALEQMLSEQTDSSRHVKWGTAINLACDPEDCPTFKVSWLPCQKFSLS